MSELYNAGRAHENDLTEKPEQIKQSVHVFIVSTMPCIKAIMSVL